MKNVLCAICKNNENTKLLFKENFDFNKITNLTFSARRTPDRIHYKFVKCYKCGLIFSNPIMSEQKIEKLYEESDFNYLIESKYLRKTYFNYFKKN